MSQLVGQNKYKNAIRKLLETDPGHADTFNPLYQDLINNDVHLKAEISATQAEIAQARGGKASLHARLLAIESETLQGESTFGSAAGRTVSHSLGHTGYIVNVVPLEDTKGDLGDVHITRAANAFTVYNSGGFTGTFRYQIQT